MHNFPAGADFLKSIFWLPGKTFQWKIDVLLRATCALSWPWAGEHSFRCQGEAALVKTTETAQLSLARSTAWQSDNSTQALRCVLYVLCSPGWPTVFRGNGLDALTRQALLCEGRSFSCGGTDSALIFVQMMDVCKFSLCRAMLRCHSGERSRRTHEIIGLHYARTVSVSVLWITPNMKRLSQGFRQQS